MHWYFCCKNVSSICNAKATHIFSKNINVFAIFQDRNINVTLANNFVINWALVIDLVLVQLTLVLSNSRISNNR